MASSLADVVTACAAARAGLSRTCELDFTLFDSEGGSAEPVLGHAIKGYTDGFSGLARLMRLAAPSVGDLIAYARLTDHLLSQTGIVFALPGGFFADSIASMLESDAGIPPSTIAPSVETEEFRAQCGERFYALLGEMSAMPATGTLRELVFGGHCGFVVALSRAAEAIRSGVVQACVVGAADSLVDPDVVRACAELGVLKSAERPTGFSPGEAGAAILVESQDSARARGAHIEAWLAGLSHRSEPVHRFSQEPPRGEALVAAVSEASKEARSGATHSRAGGPLRWVVSDHNGDDWRASEWGEALVRMKARNMTAEPLHMVFPAASFGETGGASAALGCCIAIRSFARRYAPAPEALVLASSYHGHKGAAVLRGPDASGL